MALTAHKDRKRRGRKVNPEKNYRAVVMIGHSANVDGKTYMKGATYRIDEETAIKLQKDKRMKVFKPGEHVTVTKEILTAPPEKKEGEKEEEPTGINPEWVKELQEYDQLTVKDAGKKVAGIKDLDLLQFLADHAEKKGSREAAANRFTDLKRSQQ